MGLSASQARLLSITARISDNELHSQQLANSKVRLADKTQQASQDYIDALNSQQLMIQTYDTFGNSTLTPLTPAYMYTYSDLKNQYGISNTAGQLLISSADAKTFDKSNNLHDFLKANGCELVANDEYAQTLTDLYGGNYSNYFDVTAGVNGEPIGETSKMLNEVGDLLARYDALYENAEFNDQGVMVQSEITRYTNYFGKTGAVSGSGSNNSYTLQDWYKKVINTFNATNVTVNDRGQEIVKVVNENLYGIIKDDAGFYGTILRDLDAINKPDFEAASEPIPEEINLSGLATTYNNSQCYADVNDSSYTGIWHMEHNLCELIFGTNNLYTEYAIKNNDGTYTLKNTTGTIEINLSKAYTGDDPSTKIGLTYTYMDKGKGRELLEGLDQASVYAPDEMKKIKDSIVDLYCDVILYLSKNDPSSLKTNSVTKDSGYTTKDATTLFNNWKNMYSSFTTVEPTVKERYNEKVQQINQAKTTFNGTSGVNSQLVENIKELYKRMTAELPNKETTDPNDAKTQWYTNLWYRLNGNSYEKSADGASGKFYKALEDNLLNSKDWLKFALEHAIVTMEQVQYTKPTETGTGLETSTWKSVIYSSLVDIQTVDDEVAIAKAEAEYTKKLNEIEAEDKKIDNDIKKLDTEHNALQTEYESIKTVIQKNVENSFKAFS